MNISYTLTGGKPVVLKEMLFKDMRGLSLYNSSQETMLSFLESFIVTPGLNIAEKFLALLDLRQRCVGSNISLRAEKGNVDVDMSYIMSNIGVFEDVRSYVTVDGIDFVFNYPTKFNSGNTDFIFSAIESVDIDGDKIVLSSLSDSDYKRILSSLPRDIYGHLDTFIQSNSNKFEFLIVDEKPSAGLQEIRLNILSTATTQFLLNLFDCISGPSFRDTIFVLSKRIPDINFILNSTYVEIEDYFSLYKKETEESNDLQNENV